MLLQLIGAIVFGFIIGTVGTILMSWGLLEERISRKLAELREFMNEKNVPKATRKKVKKFMEDYYRSKAGYDETEVVSALPPAIAVELLDSIYRGTLLKVPIFRHLDEDVICRICLLMKPMTVAKGEYVFNEKDRGREMYIIREGRIQIMRYGMTIGVLHKHCFFGEDCMMAVEPGKKNYRQRTAFAIEDCELAFLRATDADKIALDYPEMLSSFQDLAAKKASSLREIALKLSQQHVGKTVRLGEVDSHYVCRLLMFRRSRCEVFAVHSDPMMAPKSVVRSVTIAMDAEESIVEFSNLWLQDGDKTLSTHARDIDKTLTRH